MSAFIDTSVWVVNQRGVRASIGVLSAWSVEDHGVKVGRLFRDGLIVNVSRASNIEAAGAATLCGKIERNRGDEEVGQHRFRP